MALKVIGTGFGRTGTNSMHDALNILGFGPCHHMMELKDGTEGQARWRKFVGSDMAPDWDWLFEGYNSCVDWPSAHYWRELIDYYPEAKVLLTWRPAEDWWKSFENTLLRYVQAEPDHKRVGVRIIETVFGPLPIARDRAIAIYEENVAAVKATVPADRLLIHRLGDGWEPLCAHLGVPVPEVPYPHTNTTAEMQARQAQAQAQQQQQQ